MRPEDLLRMTVGDHYELIDGESVRKPVGARADEVAGVLMSAVVAFVRGRRLGRVYGGRTGYDCFPNRRNHVRVPDGSFVAAGRLPGDRSLDGHIGIPPDLAVEVIAPGEWAEVLWERLADYQSVGVRLVWVVNPATRTVQIRRADGTVAEIDETGTLSGEDVLPGFTCPVAELFV